MAWYVHSSNWPHPARDRDVRVEHDAASAPMPAPWMRIRPSMCSVCMHGELMDSDRSPMSVTLVQWFISTCWMDGHRGGEEGGGAT